MFDFINFSKKICDSFYINIPDINVKQKLDTYYLALDNNFMPNNESCEKIASNLSNLLKILKIEIQNLNNFNEKLLFPIDFRDEYVGFLIIKKYLNNDLIIDFGISTQTQGYSYYPSKFEDFDQKTEIDYIEGWNFLISKNDFIININNSIIICDNYS